MNVATFKQLPRKYITYLITAGGFLFEKILYPRQIAPSSKVKYFDFHSTKKKNSKIAFTAHVYYEDFAGEFLSFVRETNQEYKYFITTPKIEIFRILERDLSTINVEFDLRLTPNRGRNFGPLLVEFGNDLLDFEFMVHVHSKQSPHAKIKTRSAWSPRLLGEFLNPKVLEKFENIFYQEAGLGVIQVDCSDLVRSPNLYWGTNFRHVKRAFGDFEWFENIPKKGRLIFPIGGMFMARTSAISNILDTRLGYEDFQEERGQLDGTLQHGLERLVGELALSNGFTIGTSIQHGQSLILISRPGHRNKY
jgi:rhamnosyltransferase